MAVGVLPGQVNGRLHKMALDTATEAVSSPIETPPSPVARQDSFCRPFFWEVVSLCDLYSVVHVILLPSPLRGSDSALSPRNGVRSTNGVNGHRPTSHAHAPSRLAAALANLGLGPAHWTATGVSVFTAVLPSTGGYASRSDFLQLRLQDFPFPISKIHGCVDALKKYTPGCLSSSIVNSEDGLASLIEQAAGVIQWADLDTSVSILELQRYLLAVTHELRDRLDNAPWFTSQPIARKRIALIRGRPNLTAGGPVYRAARALGLDLVVVDDEGHWLQPDTEDNRMHREAFLATDMTEDAGVVSRIIASIRSYPLPIHGVFTLSDNFFVATARVAEALGLPTSPVSAFETSVDKYRSRLLQDAPGHTARVTSVAELDTLLSPATNDPIFTPKYPLIVKPTKGWSSECVSKVTHPSDLPLAVAKATARHGSAAVIEPFFDGPEIDANFVLLDGELLFCEIADEPPCQADAAAATVHATFSPEALTMPSALPADEQATARETLREILVGMGFRTGVFHVEARVVNSAVEYRDDGDGVVDLVEKETPPPEKAACKLVEINARPPGYRVSVPSRHTYGVDYFAAHMLAAVGDAERLRMLARPFDHAPEGRTRGAQYWSRLVYVPAPREGVVRWPSGLPPCEELKRRRPDLKDKIVVAVDYCVPGDRVGLYTDGARTYVAHLLVCSRVSRREAIMVGEEVLRAFEIEVEDI
ncbi:c87677e2-16f1-4d48-9344-bfbc0571b81d [Thermothielavioides terrestris]|uniref:C87677e2-16f1-4d48-9344-bfbc0571b81d n=1 Tax=Thermothielavioides terrestris TaxID=2587410 RepID=A0A446BED7_9PEZI|nr:c87677e2-16f1-4d48-9344-bfbc0571b81d [Thermothielavioides terrestris]